MIPFGSEALLPAGVLRFRIASTNVAADDPALFAQIPKRPFKIGNGESSILPICHCVIRPKTIEINRNVNVSVAEIGNKHFEMVAPIFPQDRTATLSIFDWAIIGPGVNFKPAFALATTVGKDIVRPPALEISAAPNRDVLNVRELKRTIDPSTTAPFRGTNIPVRVIIE